VPPERLRREAQGGFIGRFAIQTTTPTPKKKLARKRASREEEIRRGDDPGSERGRVLGGSPAREIKVANLQSEKEEGR